MSSIIKRPTMVLLAFLLSASSIASVNSPFFALNTKFEGDFSKAKSIYFFNYTSQEACLEDDGLWNNEDQVCEFETEDMINVKKKDPMFYEVAISTIGTNAHSCTFYGAAHPISSNSLKAVAPATAINPNTGEWEETTCEVTLKYKNDKVSVEDNGKCREYCGARAHLFIEGAKRK